MHTQLIGIFHKTEIRIAVVKVLGDGRVSASFDLGGKGLQVSLGRFGLWVNLWVGGHFNAKVVTCLGANKRHQIAGVMKLTARAKATGQVTTQSHQALDAHGFEFGQLLTHAVAGGTDAREVRCSRHALAQNFFQCRNRAGLGGATRTISDRAKLRLERVQGLAHNAQLLCTFRRLRRKKLNAQAVVRGHLYLTSWRVMRDAHPSKILGCHRHRQWRWASSPTPLTSMLHRPRANALLPAHSWLRP